MTPTMDPVLDAASPTVAQYVAAVTAALADLPAGERDELLEDLTAHLNEIAAEEDATGALEASLGPPAAYAAELRAAAGLGPSAAAGASDLRRRARSWFDRARASAAGRRIESWFPELRIVGWFAVGAIAVEGIARLLDFEASRAASGPLQLAGGVAMVLLARRPAAGVWARRFRYGVAAVAAVVGVVMALAESDRDQVVYEGVDTTFYPGGTVYTLDGRPISNVFPYSLDGEPLDGVLLYDQDNQPINAPAVFEESGGPPIPANQYPRPTSGFEAPPARTVAPPVTTMPAVSTLPPAPTTAPPVETTAPPTSIAAQTSTAETTAPPVATLVPDTASDTAADTTPAPQTTPAAEPPTSSG